MPIPFLHKLYGNLVVLKHLRGQAHLPYLPQEQLWKIRDARLRRMIRHAAQTVPYYQNLFRQEKIDPRAIQTIHHLDALPLIGKEILQRDPMQFVSQSKIGLKAIPVMTSGSSGDPLKVYHDYYSLLANIAFGKRERKVISDICGKTSNNKEVFILNSGSTFWTVWDLYRRWTFYPFKQNRRVLNILDPVEELVSKINRFQPDTLFSYGSYLETLFRLLNLRGIKMHRPRVLIYWGDPMSREGKKFIEDQFGIPVRTTYQAIESLKIGFSCEKQTGLHLHEDLCAVKIIHPDGTRADEGQRGEVVISNLINRGTVLLNYRLGDTASLTKEKCPCGRTLPMLSDLEGRLVDVFVLKDGRLIHPSTINTILLNYEGILNFQMIQHEADRFELKMVTVDVQTYQRIIKLMVMDLKDLFGKSSIIEPGYYENLKPSLGGKFRPFISLCRMG